MITLDEIMIFLDVVVRNFSNFATLLNQRLSQIFDDVGLKILGDLLDKLFELLGIFEIDGTPLTELEFLQILFGTGIVIYLAVTLIKYFVDLAIPN